MVVLNFEKKRYYLDRDFYKYPIDNKLCLERKDITSVVGELPTNLIELDLADNQLIEFTHQLPPDLIHLYLDNNLLTKFTSLLPPSLITLYLYDNKLNEFTQELHPNLQYLDLSNNHLTEFIQPLPLNLIDIDLTNNPIKDLNGKEYRIKKPEELTKYQEIIRMQIKNKTIKSANK